MDEFRCPKCGGTAFSTDTATGERRCNSDANGHSLSERFDDHLRPLEGTSPIPCGWRSEPRQAEITADRAASTDRRMVAIGKCPWCFGLLTSAGDVLACDNDVFGRPVGPDGMMECGWTEEGDVYGVPRSAFQ